MVASVDVTQSSDSMIAVDLKIERGIANGTILKPIPTGKYTIVGIDIDTTGRRLIDEIVQLAAYTPKDHFEQYIMPYMNLNPAARQRHQVRVISIGFYRMLKSMQTYKIIKSKSEIAAIKDFLEWLEALKAKDTNSQGIILVYHEERKFIPYMILESLKKYNLLDRFQALVKSFANGLNLAKSNIDDSLQHYTLRKLSKVLSVRASETSTGDNEISSTTTGEQQPLKKNNTHIYERDLFDGNASVRAKLAYEVAYQLSNQENTEPPEAAGAMDKMLTAVHQYAYPVQVDLEELQIQNENLERQNSFRPVFLNYFKTTLYHRVRAVKFRIILAEQGYDLQALNNIWNEKQKIGLAEVLEGINELKAEDKSELADLFDSYFDPAKATIKPIVKNINRRRNKRPVRNGVKNDGNNNTARAGAEQGAGGDKQGVAGAGQLPDSTTKSPNAGANGNAKPQRGKRNPRVRNNSHKASASESQLASPASATAAATTATETATAIANPAASAAAGTAAPIAEATAPIAASN